MDALKLFYCAFALSLVQFSTQTLVAPAKPVKDGFYKITNVKDGLALTATRKGQRPHEVMTDVWRNEMVQHWKVKSKMQDGIFLQIIRNEQIRENEVTKEKNYENVPGGKDFVPLDWNFVAAPGRPNTFVLFNGLGCLIGHGLQQRIEITYCDEEAPTVDKLWEVEFLYPIPK